MTKQYDITSAVFKFGASSVTLHVADKRIKIYYYVWFVLFYSFWSVTLVDTIKIISIIPPSVIQIYIQIHSDHSGRNNRNYFNSMVGDWMADHSGRAV
jgi:hypothetical protein